MDDDVDFAGVGAALAVGFGALAIADSTGSAWILLLLATAIVVARAWWRSMPPALLILGPFALAMVTEANGTASNGWLIVCVALVVAMAGSSSTSTWIGVTIVVSGPLWLWIAGVDDYVELGPWTWMMGLLLSAVFGAVLHRQRVLIGRLEDTREQLAQAAAEEERSRIASELHDVVGHSFSVVLLHLSGARRMLDTEPERARQALAEAERVGRRSMDDLRAALVLLHSNDRGYVPVQEISALPTLVDQFSRAGLDVSLDVVGDIDSLDTASRVVLFGVAREALTNAAKHGAGAVAVLLQAGSPPGIVVRNTVAPGASLPSSNDRSTQGLDGMRRRVEAMGGAFNVAIVGTDWVLRADLASARTNDDGAASPSTARRADDLEQPAPDGVTR